MTVDHFQPVAAGGRDDDNNLVYACFRCNLFKSDYYDGTDSGTGIRSLLHPQLEDASAHLRANSDGSLYAITERGRFHISVFHLNRPQLIAYRHRAQEAEVLRQRERRLALMLKQVEEMLNEMRQYLAELQ